MEDLLAHMRREIRAAEKRLRGCVMFAVGVGVLVLAGLMLGLTALVIGTR